MSLRNKRQKAGSLRRLMAKSRAADVPPETKRITVPEGQELDPAERERLECAGWTLVRTVQRGWYGATAAVDYWFERHAHRPSPPKPIRRRG
jgi:hypothetical protein